MPMPAGGEGPWVEADADSVFLGAEHVYLGYSVDGGDALGEDGLGEFIDLGERERLGRKGNQQN